MSFTDNSSSHPKKTSFENAINKLKEVVPGVQASVRSIDGKLWTGSVGFSDINNGVEMKNCSKFLVGSVSKIFTSILIMQLQEKDLLTEFLKAEQKRKEGNPKSTRIHSHWWMAGAGALAVSPTVLPC